MSANDTPYPSEPDSPAQAMLKKVDRRDKFVRSLEVGILFVALLFNVFVAVKSVQTQQTIQNNQASNIQRIQSRNQDLQEYLTCVLTLPISARSADAIKACEVQNSTSFPGKQ